MLPANNRMGLSELLFFGDLAKRAYDFWASRGAPFSSDGFMATHSAFVRQSIDLVPQIDAFPPEQIDAAIASVLSHLASIVKAYHKEASVSVNANYMVPYDPTAELREVALFTRKDRDPNSFRCFLKLEQWADDSSACPSVVLPVENSDGVDAQLFGAPKAFALKRPQIVGDTWDITSLALEHENEKIRREIHSFFAEEQKERLRSFASFPVVAPVNVPHSCPTSVIGVLNLDANRKHLLGFHQSNQRKLGLALEPVVHVLSHFLVRRHWRQTEEETGAGVTAS